MDEEHVIHGIRFIWNIDKAKSNRHKHGISFICAAEAFFDPFLKILDASRNNENRDAVLGMDKQWNLLFVVHIQIEEDTIRLISARRATRREYSHYEI